MKDLTTSDIDRQNVLNNTLVLDNLRAYLGVPSMLFQGEYTYTKQQISEFYQIDIATIERYLENMKDCSYYTLPDDSKKPNWLAIPFQCKDRLELVKFMEKNEVQTRVTFAGNITRHPAFRKYLDDFENADKIMKDGFLLGAHHGMTISDVDRVCNLLKKFADLKLNGKCSVM